MLFALLEPSLVDLAVRRRLLPIAVSDSISPFSVVDGPIRGLVDSLSIKFVSLPLAFIGPAVSPSEDALSSDLVVFKVASEDISI